MFEGQAIMTVFAGPNGSGKSTLTRKMKSANPDDLPSLYINADELLQQLGLTPLEAAQEATRLRYAAVEKNLSFAFETVMSTEEKIDFFLKAKAAGFVIRLVFITTRDAAINVSRVSNRVVKGEHDVPEEKIRSRYRKSMDLLPKALEIADYGWVFDNSGEAPVLIAKKTLDGVLHLYPRKGDGWSNLELKAWLNAPCYSKIITYIPGTKIKMISRARS